MLKSITWFLPIVCSKIQDSKFSGDFQERRNLRGEGWQQTIHSIITLGELQETQSETWKALHKGHWKGEDVVSQMNGVMDHAILLRW